MRVILSMRKLKCTPILYIRTKEGEKSGYRGKRGKRGKRRRVLTYDKSDTGRIHFAAGEELLVEVELMMLRQFNLK